MQEKRITRLGRIKVLQKASFWVFLVLGLSYIGLEIARTNGIYANESGILQRSLDLPFAFAALLYGISSVRLALSRTKSEALTITLFMIGAVVMVALIYANFLLADV